MHVLCLLAQSCPTLCNPTECSTPGSSVHGDPQGKNTGVGCHTFLWGIFPTQGLDPGLLHCRWSLYQLSHKESPRILELVSSVSSITQSCPTLCDPMNRSTPDTNYEFTQTHVHRVSDAIQPSHPLSSPSPPAPNPS